MRIRVYVFPDDDLNLDNPKVLGIDRTIPNVELVCAVEPRYIVNRVMQDITMKLMKEMLPDGRYPGCGTTVRNEAD